MANIEIDLFGKRFKNPIIPAAGPNVGTGEQLKRAAEGGAGGLLAKTVSVKAADVPRPCMVKFDRFGMLNAELWTELTLEQWIDHEYPIAMEAAKTFDIPLWASVGYSPEELAEVGPKVEAAGVDAIEFSIHYLDPAKIVDTAKALRDAVSIPIVAKFSPHAGDLGELAMAIEPYVDGFACINSVGPTLMVNRDKNEPWLGSRHGYGWLSGAPIKPIALRCVYEVARRTTKPVIGVGGVTTPEDVIEFFMAGASLVGVCSIIMYRGQSYHRKLAEGVSRWLDRHGYEDIAEVKGRFLKERGEDFGKPIFRGDGARVATLGGQLGLKGPDAY